MRGWSPERRRTFPYHTDPFGQPLGPLAEHVGVLRYVLTPDMLRGVNAHLDYAFFHRETRRQASRLLGHGDRRLPAYGPGRFTWVPPDEPFDFRTRAYRDVPKSQTAADTRHLGPVDIVNLLLGPPLYIRRATAEITFR